jgi:hypothetical protein
MRDWRRRRLAAARQRPEQYRCPARACGIAAPQTPQDTPERRTCASWGAFGLSGVAVAMPTVYASEWRWQARYWSHIATGPLVTMPSRQRPNRACPWLTGRSDAQRRNAAQLAQ